VKSFFARVEELLRPLPFGISKVVCIFSVLKHFFAGVEKKNGDLQRYFHPKINQWDVVTNLLLVEKHQEVLRDMERTKHSCEKKQTSCWLEGRKTKSARW